MFLIVGLSPAAAGAVAKPIRKPAASPRLEPIQLKAGTLRGVVKSHMGKPVVRTSVELLDAKGKVIARSVTNSQGEYVLQNVPAGKYTVRVGGRTRLPITMTREATVSRLLIVPRYVGAASGAAASSSTGFLGLGTWAWVAIGGGVAAAVAIPLAASGGGGGGGGDSPVSP